MKQTIQLRLGQHLTMTPQLQQAIKLLQLSTLELQKEIQDVLDTNLMLEEGDEAERFIVNEANDMRLAPVADPEPTYPDETRIDREIQSESNEIPNELPIDTQWDDVYDSYPTATGNGSDEHADFDPLTQKSRPLTLHDHLLWQLTLSRLTDRELMIAQMIIDAIDADGYLRSDIPDLLASLNDPTITAEEVQTLIYRVQALDPAGVGARNVQECLLIQLRQLPPETPFCRLAMKICRKGFNALPRKDINALLRICDAPETEITAAIALIRSLQPRPGTTIVTEAPEYVIPDVFVRKIAGRWRVELNGEATPKIRVNNEYLNLIRRTDQNTDTTLLRNHLQEARWFIKSLVSRNETVLRVGAKIVEMQQDFFERGDEGMRPMILRDIAEQLELHESTVSRVTTQKYMNTPRGTFEFKYFFSSHVTTASGGECSSTAIRALMRKLIALESTKKPLSDDKIAKDLADQGIKVARRTVAKYREAMGIPPSNERKRLN